MSVNPMQLLPIAYPAHASIRGVQFAMLDLGMLVHILVTHAALDRIEKAADGDDGYVARFAKHRGKFEQVANDKYVRGDIEPSGAIAVLPGDL
jgi:Protein of unknown function (DUF1488)